jgi:hypothetical protein
MGIISGLDPLLKVNPLSLNRLSLVVLVMHPDDPLNQTARLGNCLLQNLDLLRPASSRTDITNNEPPLKNPLNVFAAGTVTLPVCEKALTSEDTNRGWLRVSLTEPVEVKAPMKAGGGGP